MFDKELMVLQDFDPTKSLEDYEFNDVPIWIRIFKLPLGMMNGETGEQIGQEVGEFLEAAVGDDGMAVGKFLRIRVRIDLRKPLMRGITLHFGDDMLPKWCPFEYEFLPEFCFTCGIIGHIDKVCTVKLKKGEKQQYGLWLKAVMEGREAGGSGQRWKEMGGVGGSRRGSSYGFGSRNRLSGSDSDSWKVVERQKKNSQTSGEINAELAKPDQEATSPLKLPFPKTDGRGSQRRLELVGEEVVGGKGSGGVEHGPKENAGMEAQNGVPEEPDVHGSVEGSTSITPSKDTSSTGQELEGQGGKQDEGVKSVEEKKTNGTVRRLRGGKSKNREGKNNQAVEGQSQGGNIVGGKRSAVEDEMELDVREQKRSRFVKGLEVVEEEENQNLKAGLPGQPCGDQ
jgi:hypothetical protein